MIAVYPGSFDPMHNGHVDVVERACAIFDTVVVAVFANATKKALFDSGTRVQLIRQSINRPNVEVVEGSGLLVDFARSHGAGVIIRGLRAVLDFDYEFQFALMNKRMAPSIETVFMLTRENHAYLSSTLIKELAGYGADISALVPPPVAQALVEHFDEK